MIPIFLSSLNSTLFGEITASFAVRKRPIFRVKLMVKIHWKEMFFKAIVDKITIKSSL